jgi:hypothetical protein
VIGVRQSQALFADLQRFSCRDRSSPVRFVHTGSG